MERNIVLFNYDEQSQKDTMLTHVAKSDRYRVGDLWYQGLDDWLHSYPVDEVSKPGIIPTGFAVGDIVKVFDVSDELVTTFKVTAIQMCSFDNLDFSSIGYKDRAEFIYQNPLFENSSRAWLVFHSHPES